MANTIISRRALLRGSLAGTAVHVGLPPLEAMFNGNGTALAAGAAMPLRFGVFWWGNGVRMKHWTPDATGFDWVAKEELAPFANVKESVSVVTGMGLVTGTGAPAHHMGRACQLTATGERVSVYGASILPSIDQVVAKAWAGKTRFSSIDVLVSQRGFSNARARGQVSQTGNGGFSPGEPSPAALFDRLFGGGTTLPSSADEAKKVLSARASVLDSVKADIRRLNARLGAADKVSLEQHLSGIRSLEVQLQMVPANGTCARPARPGGASQDFSHEPLEEIAHAMADLLVLALACDLTRVFTFEFTQMQSDTVFWQVGMNEGLHTITHRSGVAAEDQAHKATVFTMKQFSYLAEKMKAVKEGAGTLLDNSCVYGTSEVSEGFSHDWSNMPILVIGGAGGGLKAGQHIKSAKRAESSNKVLLSMLKGLGLPLTQVGTATSVTVDVIPAMMGNPRV